MFRTRLGRLVAATITTAALFLHTAPPAGAALTVPQIVTNLQLLTAKSQALQLPARSITVINGPLIVVGLGPYPQIISGFTEIITITDTSIAQLSGTPRITTSADATAVANAYRTYATVTQNLLNILITKAGLFNAMPLIGQPVTDVLRALKSRVDALTFQLVDLVSPSVQKAQIVADHNSLSGALVAAINSYDGLTVG